tara:strand:- start:653 stop:970 length:318 start_codon:yes stop_codon:yes gene_type:complete
MEQLEKTIKEIEMSKLSQKDADALVSSGVLSDKAREAMVGKGFVSKKRSTVRKFMKTADGKMVEPMFYFRGGKDTTNSKRQNEFMSKYNTLVSEYATTVKATKGE